MARFAAVALVAASGALAAPAAMAAGPGQVRVARASAVVQQAGAAALAGKTKARAQLATPPVGAAEGVQKPALSVASEAAAPPVERPEPPRPTCRLGEGCSYRTLLGYLVITKDFDIPGAPGMALRLIPTNSSLGGGSTAPIVLKPRVVGSSWSGLEIAAKF